MSADALLHLHNDAFDDDADAEAHDAPSAPHDLVLEALHRAYPPVFKNLLQQTRQEGREEGQAAGEVLVLSRHLARRLGRALTEAEQEGLLRWTAAHPGEEAIDAVLDLNDAAAAQTWLARLA